MFGKNTILTIFGCNLSPKNMADFWILSILESCCSGSESSKKNFFFQILIFDPKRIFFVFCSIKSGKMPWKKYGVCCREHMLNTLDSIKSIKICIYFQIYFLKLGNNYFLHVDLRSFFMMKWVKKCCNVECKYFFLQGCVLKRENEIWLKFFYICVEKNIYAHWRT